MRVALLDIQTRDSAVNKTMAGGYGTSSDYGDDGDARIRLLKQAKRNGVRIPLVEFAYLTAIFKDRGHDVVVSYGTQIPDADVYLVYISLVEFNHEMEAVREIRRTRPGAVVGLLGTMATAMPARFAGEADFVVCGECESLFAGRNGHFDDLHGIVRAAVADDPDRLPLPDWSAFDMSQFVHRPFFGDLPVYPVLASRGCPFACRYYCAYPLVSGGQVRFRQIDAIVDELTYLHESYGAQAVLFRDPNFSLDMKRTAELCEKIIEARLPIHWACETHLSRLNRPLVELMYRAGARAITVGIESRSPAVLKSSHRPDCGEQHLLDMVAYCERVGVSIMAGYILGAPGDTAESIRHTIEYAKFLNTSFAQFTVCTPYPGTKFFADVERRLLTRNWERFDSYTPVFEHPTLSAEELVELKQQAYREYYFRPRWIAKYLRGQVNGFLERYRDRRAG